MGSKSPGHPRGMSHSAGPGDLTTSRRAELLWHGTLQLLYSGRKEQRLSSSERGAQWFLAILEAAQFLGFVFRHFCFPGSPFVDVGNVLSVWPLLFRVETSTGYFAAWVFVFVFGSLLLCNGAFVAYMHHTGTFTRNLPVQTLKALVCGVVCGTLLPFLEMLALPLRCDELAQRHGLALSTCAGARHVWMTVSAIGYLAIFIPLCLIYVASVFDDNPLIRHPSARPSGRFDALVSLSSSILVVTHVLASTPTTVAVVGTILFVVLTGSVVVFVPYYVPRMNRLKCCSFACLAVLSLFGAILCIGRTTLSGGAVAALSTTAVVLAVLLAGAAFHFALHRSRQLEQLAEDVLAGRVSLSDLRQNEFVEHLGSGIASTYGADYKPRQHRRDGEDTQSLVSFSVVPDDESHASVPFSGHQEHSMLVERGTAGGGDPESSLLSPRSGMEQGLELPVAHAGAHHNENALGAPEPVADHGGGSAAHAAITSGKQQPPLAKMSSYVERGVEAAPPRPSGLISGADVEVVVRHILFGRVVDTNVLRHAEMVFERGVAMFPESAYVAQQYAHFLVSNKRAWGAALKCFEHVEERYPSIDLRFRLYTGRRTIEQRAAGATGDRAALDPAAMAEFLKYRKTARRAHSHVLKHMSSMWKAAANGKEHRIRRSLLRAVAFRGQASAAYERLVTAFPRTPDVLRQFAQFKDVVLNAPGHEVTSLLREADAIEDAEARVRGEIVEMRAYNDTGTGSQMSSTRENGDSSRLRLVPIQTERTAVQTISRAVVLAIFTIVAVNVATYLATSSTLDFLVVTDLDEAGSRRAITTQAAYYSRLLHLSIITPIPTLIPTLRQAVQDQAANFERIHTELYKARAEPSPLHDLYYEPAVIMRSFDPYGGAPRAEGMGVLRNMSMSLWDAGNEYIRNVHAVIKASDTTLSDPRNRNLRFLWDNGIQQLLPVMRKASTMYEEEIFQAASDNHRFQGGLLLGNLLIPTVVAILIAVLTIPVIRDLEVRSGNARAVLKKVPHGVLRQLSRAADKGRLDLIDPSQATLAEDGKESSEEPLHGGEKGGDDGGSRESDDDGESKSDFMSHPGIQVFPRQRPRLDSDPGQQRLPRRSEKAPASGSTVGKERSAGTARLVMGDGDRDSPGSLDSGSLVGSSDDEQHAAAAPDNDDLLLASPSADAGLLESLGGIGGVGGDARPGLSPPLPESGDTSQSDLSNSVNARSVSTVNAAGILVASRSQSASASVPGLPQVVIHRRNRAGRASSPLEEPLESLQGPTRKRGGRLGKLTASKSTLGSATDDEAYGQGIEGNGSLVAKVEEDLEDQKGEVQQCSRAWLVVARLAVFLIATSTIAVLTYTTSQSAVDRAQYYSADVNRSGERKELSAQISAMVTEYIRNDGEVFPDRQETAARLVEAIDRLEYLHAGLSQGNASLRLLGLDKRDPKQDKLMYEPGCLSPACAGGEDSRSFAQHVSAGLDVLVRTFIFKARLLLARYRNQQGPRHVGLMLGDPDFADMVFIESYDFGNAVTMSVNLIIAEADAYISAARGRVETLFIVSLTVLLVTYYITLRTIPTQLAKSAAASRELLLFFPQHVIHNTPEVRRMFEEDASTYG